MSDAPPPCFATVGANPTRLWGLTPAERNRRIARSAGLAECGAESGSPMLLANAAFAFDPSWLRHAAAEPGFVLTLGGVPALAHVAASEAEAVRAAMAEGRPAPLPAIA